MNLSPHYVFKRVTTHKTYRVTGSTRDDLFPCFSAWYFELYFGRAYTFLRLHKESLGLPSEKLPNEFCHVWFENRRVYVITYS